VFGCPDWEEPGICGIDVERLVSMRVIKTVKRTTAAHEATEASYINRLAINCDDVAEVIIAALGIWVC